MVKFSKKRGVFRVHLIDHCVIFNRVLTLFTYTPIFSLFQFRSSLIVFFSFSKEKPVLGWRQFGLYTRVVLLSVLCGVFEEVGNHILGTSEVKRNRAKAETLLMESHNLAFFNVGEGASSTLFSFFRAQFGSNELVTGNRMH